MIATIPDILLARLSDFVAATMGLHFPKERWRDLERGIINAAQDFHFDDPEQCVQWLLSSAITKQQIEILASHLTVGETFFLESKKVLKPLKSRSSPRSLTRAGEPTNTSASGALGVAPVKNPTPSPFQSPN